MIEEIVTSITAATLLDNYLMHRTLLLLIDAGTARPSEHANNGSFTWQVLLFMLPNVVVSLAHSRHLHRIRLDFVDRNCANSWLLIAHSAHLLRPWRNN